MRTILIGTLAMAFFSQNLMAGQDPADSKPVTPTAEQLADAEKAYAKFGAVYIPYTHPEIKRSPYFFKMPRTTTDADVKDLPNLPFKFFLDFENTKISDVGLKQIGTLKNLSGLALSNTAITNAGLKELKNLNNLSELYLGNTMVTDAG